MAWGGSGKFLFDNASIELGYVPIERIIVTPEVAAILDYVITFRRRRR